jgi:hypothetical protein
MDRPAPVARRLFDPLNMDYDPIYEFEAPKYFDFCKNVTEHVFENDIWFKIPHPTHESKNIDNLLKGGHGGHPWRVSRRVEEPVDMNHHETDALEKEFRFLLQKARLTEDIDATGWNPETWGIQKWIPSSHLHTETLHSRKSVGGHISPKFLNLKGGARRVPVVQAQTDTIPTNKENNAANETVLECASPSTSTTPKKAAPTSRLLSTPPRASQPPPVSIVATAVSSAPTLAPALTSPAKPTAPTSSAKSPARVPLAGSPRGGLSPRSLKLGAPQRVKVLGMCAYLVP